MAYTKQNFTNGNTLNATQLNAIEDGIVAAHNELEQKQPKGTYLTEVPDGYATEDFVKNKIAEAELSGSDVDLSGYVTKDEVPTKTSQLTNDSGFLTEHQDLTDYAKKTDIPSIPVQSVNGKTGAVSIGASDVGADPSGTANSAVNAHNTSPDSHADIRELISELSGQNVALTANERSTLIAVINAIGAFNVPNGQELVDAFNTAWGGTGGTPDEPDEPVVPDIPDVPGVVQYTITNALTNVATDNPVAAVTEGSAYMATLTADDGYTLTGGTVTIKMGGVDITTTAYADGGVTIASVTGNVVITAAAVEKSTDSGEVVMLKNISFDGTSYLDTEVIPESVDYKYVFGIQIPKTNTDGAAKCFAGVSMRDSTDPAVSAYWDVYWDVLMRANNYNSDAPDAQIREQCMSLVSAISTGNDKGDGLSSQPYNVPLYYAWSRNAQSVWLDEGLTSTPVLGHFPGATATVDFTNQAYYTDDEHPISSIWLGKVHVTGVMAGQIGAQDKTLAGVKFYCFKTYDSNGNLIADMRPAKQGGTAGMWDTIRNKFYPATGTANYEEVSA